MWGTKNAQSANNGWFNPDEGEPLLSYSILPMAHVRMLLHVLGFR